MDKILEAMKALEGASLLLVDSQKNTAAARSREVEALNRVNEAQKCVDRLIAEMKASAPHQSDWASAPAEKL